MQKTHVTIHSDPPVTIIAERAVSDHQHLTGLMHRTELANHHGMLFDYDPPMIVHMWMKNTLIPLDMLFINDNQTIETIVHNAQPHDETPRSSIAAVRYVLEINGGLATTLNITGGEHVTIKDVQ